MTWFYKRIVDQLDFKAKIMTWFFKKIVDQLDFKTKMFYAQPSYAS